MTLDQCRERVTKCVTSGGYYAKWWDEWMTIRHPVRGFKTAYLACEECNDVIPASAPQCLCGQVSSEKAASAAGETPPDDDKFIEEELALAALLLFSWQAALTRYEVFDRLSKAAESNNLSDIDAEATRVGNDLANAYDDAEISADVAKELDRTFERGLEVAGALAFLLNLAPARDRFNDGIENQARYFTNNYFRRIVHPQLLAELDRNITSLTGSDDMHAVLQAHLNTGLFESEPYWRIVANQDVSRAHHYGVLRGMENRGYTEYRFVAVLDNRTTKLCRSLNGTVFRVADAINHLETIARADPEAVRSLAPWVSATDVAGRTAAELTAMGVMVPPLHANCRSTLMAVA